MECFSRLVWDNPALNYPIWVFSNNQLMIYFLMHIFKCLQCHSINCDIEGAKAEKRALRQPVAYQYETRDANCITDDMARRALDGWVIVTYWNKHIPEDMPGNHLQVV